MSSTHGQRGEGRLGLLIALAVVGAAAFALVKYVPVRVTAYEFRDFMEQECRTAAVRPNDTKIVERILNKAEELEIPLDKKNLMVKRTQSEMVISARYEQPIDFKVKQYVYVFDHKYKAPLF